MKGIIWSIWLCVPLVGLGQYQIQRAAVATAVGTVAGGGRCGFQPITGGSGRQ